MPSPTPTTITTTTADTILDPSRAYQLGKHGFVVVDHFIPDAATLHELRLDVETLRAAGRFRSARIGHNGQSSRNSSSNNKDMNNGTNTTITTLQVNPDIRLAETCFLHNHRQDNEYPNAARNATLKRLVQLRDELSMLLLSSKNVNNNHEPPQQQPLEPELDDLLYVYYPHGGFYKCHVDATPGTPTVLRKFSILLYLNAQDWTDDMGGQLRLFVMGDKGDTTTITTSGSSSTSTTTTTTPVDILPVGGRLVLFESDRIPHQVMETNQTRMVLVGWFSRAPTDQELLEFGAS